MEAEENGGLSTEEDDALRRLSFFADLGNPSDWTENRIAEFRSHDRRSGIRPPRDELLPILDTDDQNDPDEGSDE